MNGSNVFLGRRKTPASPKLECFFNRHASVPFDAESAAIAGPLRKKLESQGKVIGPHDLQIAAIKLQPFPNSNDIDAPEPLYPPLRLLGNLRR